MAKNPKDNNGHNVPQINNEFSDELAGMAEQDSGKGVSFNQDDQLIPLIYVLQSNSPSVDKRSEAYIQGAEPGHFWLRNALHPIIDGITGMEAIPCGMHHTWIEWLPNRGGFVTRHFSKPADMETKMVKNVEDGREKPVTQRPNGNLIVDTREFYILVGVMPYVLPCSGTKHTFARQWQTTFHQFRHPRTGQVLPSFARKYLLTTIPQQNAQGKWFGIKFEDRGYVSAAEYKDGRKLNETVESGEKKAEAPMQDAAAGGGDDIPF